jgi:hypothetical protein
MAACLLNEMLEVKQHRHQNCKTSQVWQLWNVLLPVILLCAVVLACRCICNSHCPGHNHPWCTVVFAVDLAAADEPTSGLDSFAALSVMSHLQGLAHDSGKAVVAAIHQPRSAIWSLFDKVCPSTAELGLCHVQLLSQFKLLVLSGASEGDTACRSRCLKCMAARPSTVYVATWCHPAASCRNARCSNHNCQADTCCMAQSLP